MRWTTTLIGLAAWLGIASAQSVTTTVVRDPETGFTFAHCSVPYQLGSTMSFRVAVPSSATNYYPYDAVVQIIAPINVGWAALAWGGRMINNPLTVAWWSGTSAVVSSRSAQDHIRMPTAFAGATYTVLKTGTRSNSTHWQVTAKCTGCTSLPNSGGRVSYLEPGGSNRLAMAFAGTRPANPASNTSTFVVHEAHAYWNHDFSKAKMANFEELVTKNGVAP